MRPVLKTTFDVYVEARIEQYHRSLLYDSEPLADAWRAFAENGEWGRATWLLASQLEFDRISVGPAFLLSVAIFADAKQSLVRAEDAYAAWFYHLSYHERIQIEGANAENAPKGTS
jgi:hypothetical protein